MVVDIVSVFNEYFEMVPVVSEQLKNEVFKLRYQVYCTETGFLNYSNYPNGLEYDEYDGHSIHYLVRHRKSQIYAATARLILPDRDDPATLFPIERYCRIDNVVAPVKSISRDKLAEVSRFCVKPISRDKLAEVSRFCVSKEFKKRKNEAGTLSGIGPGIESIAAESERRCFPHITLALIAGIIKTCDDYDIQHLYAVMEPSLLRFLSALGIYFLAVGPLTDYHGMRQPCIIKVTDLVDGVAKKNTGVWALLKNNEWFAPVQDTTRPRSSRLPCNGSGKP